MYRTAALVCLVMGGAAGCQLALEVDTPTKISCTAIGDCPEGWGCVEETGFCAIRGAVCTEDRNGELHASANGNACALSPEEVGVCVAGECARSRCGDGVVDLSRDELCDDPEGNSDTLPDACRMDCTPARCGDGVTDGGEDCDDENDDDGDMCLATCDWNFCGASGVFCGEGQVCVSGVCRDACAFDTDCDADRLCDAGSCVPKIPPIISFTTGAMELFVGSQPVDVVPVVVPGPQAASAVVTWHWVVAPDGFDTTAPPAGPVLRFSPDVVGSYALEATATHRGGSTTNTFVVQVKADYTVALMSAGSGKSVVELFTDGRAQSLMPADLIGVQAHAGLQPLLNHNAVFAGALNSLVDPQLVLAEASPDGLESEGDAASCAAAGKVWAIADDDTGGCCAAGSSGTLAIFSPGSYGCCKRGFVSGGFGGSCVVSRERPPTALVSTTANSTQSFGGQPELAGPAGNCDWTDLPPLAIDPDNVDVKLCEYQIRTLSSARDGSSVAFVLLRRFVSDTVHTPGRAGMAVIVDELGNLSSNSVQAGLPDASVVLLSTEIEAADLPAPPLAYLRLAHDPAGGRLAVLAGPMDVLASKSPALQPNAIADYEITVYDPVSHVSLAASDPITVRATWRAALLLLPGDRVVLSPDGFSVRLSTVDITSPTWSELWASPARADYVPLDASQHAALACAPLCDLYSTAPAPNLASCGDACCTCLAQSAMTDPAVTCHALAGSGDSGVAISVYDGVSRNAAGTLLSASKTTTLIPFDRCDDIFLFETADDLERVHELVTYDVAATSETHYAIATLTGADPTTIKRIPSTSFLSDDSQLSFGMRLGGSPAPPRLVEFWVMNRDGSRPRQLLPEGASFFQQTNEPPENGCAQTPLGSLPLLALLALPMLRRRRR